MKDKKSHGVQLLIRAVVRDPDGKIISDTGEKPASSFLIQFLEFWKAVFNEGPGVVNATRTTGAEGGIYDKGDLPREQFEVNSLINDSTHGVVVGTGDTAATNEDYALEAQITEGIGVGNLTHGTVVFGLATVVGANVDLEVKRAFTNQTGVTITVKEAGIYTRYSVSGPLYHCIIRDVLSPAIDVPDGCSLTICYTIRTTV